MFFAYGIGTLLLLLVLIPYLPASCDYCTWKGRRKDRVRIRSVAIEHNERYCPKCFR
jgi:hypothetical protein